MIQPDDLHVMIDLETLDLNSTAAVIQIGACAFNINGVWDTFEKTIHFDDAIKNGTVDAGTLKFWMEQPDAARKSVITGNSTSLGAIDAYKHWLSCLGVKYKKDPSHYWAHATFDFPVLNNLCKKLEVADPHYYRMTRDLRTLGIFAGEVDTSDIDEGVKHTAKDDAVYQAKIAIKQIRKLIL